MSHTQLETIKKDTIDLPTTPAGTAAKEVLNTLRHHWERSLSEGWNEAIIANDLQETINLLEKSKSNVKQENKTKFAFIKYTGVAKVEKLVILTVYHTDLPVPKQRNLVLNALHNSITAWVESTESGRNLWEECYGDLNIGDFLLNYNKEEVDPFLHKEGILKIEVSYELLNLEEEKYDKVIASPCFS